MSFVEQIPYCVDPVQSRLSTLCARKQAKRDHLHQSGEAMLRPTPTSFITSLITQVAIFRNWFLGIAVTLASYCLGNKCSDNRFTSLIADFVLENGESSCGDTSEEKKYFSVVFCWTLLLCQFFHSLVRCLTSCKADRIQTTTYPVLRTRDSAMLFCPVPDAST